MGQLILKDLFLQKRSAYIFIAMGFMFFFYFTALDQKNMVSVMVPPFLIVYSFMNRSLHEDERNHTMRLLFSLPIPRSEIVKAKYTVVATVALTTICIFVALGTAFGAVSFRDRDESLINLFIMVGFILVYTILISVFLPMAYRIGFIRAQTINRFFFFALIALGSGFGFIVKLVQDHLDIDRDPPAWVNWIGDLGSRLTEINPYVGLLLLVALCASVYLGSMILSIRYIERREMF